MAVAARDALKLSNCPTQATDIAVDFNAEGAIGLVDRASFLANVGCHAKQRRLGGGSCLKAVDKGGTVGRVGFEREGKFVDPVADLGRKLLEVVGYAMRKWTEPRQSLRAAGVR